MKNLSIKLLCLFLMISIFTIDLLIPLGVAGGVPYIVVILISLWLHDSKYVIYFSIGTSLLILLGYYFSPEGGELWKVVANRGLALFAIWTTTFLVIIRENSQAAYFQLLNDSKVREEREKIYFATIHGSQHILNNLLNKLTLVELKLKKQPDLDQNILKILASMLVESQDLIGKLSSVQDIDAETITKSVLPK